MSSSESDPSLFHKSVTEERVVEACRRRRASLDSPGICIDCGAGQEGVDPDAENAPCETCGEHMVFGVEGLLIEFVA